MELSIITDDKYTKKEIKKIYEKHINYISKIYGKAKNEIIVNAEYEYTNWEYKYKDLIYRYEISIRGNKKKCRLEIHAEETTLNEIRLNI